MPTILIVDDEDFLREALISEFKKRGYDVLGASGGRMAYEIFQKQHLDLILSDVRMPEGDGIELLDRVKQDKRTMPVFIFLTGFSDLPPPEAYDRGADCVLSKPFRRSALFATVEKALIPREERWKHRPHQVELPELNTVATGNSSSRKARVINVGRSGVCLELDVGELVLECELFFNMNFEVKHNVYLLEGCGVLKWIKSSSAPGGLATVGIEFKHLSEQSFLSYIDFEKNVEPVSYIPCR